jgi:hypothetical protein
MTQSFWCDPDNESNYKPLNFGIQNYSKTEIIYQYNQDGFRCDDFNLESSHPLLFMGCSHTEGVGLPIDEVYSYHIYKNYQDRLNIKIPFWSLGKGGTSIDYAARVLYDYCKLLKPKNIIYLMSGFYRREYCLSESYSGWFPNPSPLYNASQDFKNVSKLFSNPFFAAYESYRSLIILNFIAKNIGCKIYLFDLYSYTDKERQFMEQTKEFDQIIYTPLKNLVYNKNLLIPDKILSRPMKARDCSHYGARWHYVTSDAIWNFFKAKENL